MPKVKEVWVDVWTRAIADSVGTRTIIGYFIGDSYARAIQFEKSFLTERKNLMNAVGSLGEETLELPTDRDEVWQYEGFFTGNIPDICRYGVYGISWLSIPPCKRKKLSGFKTNPNGKGFGQQTERSWR
jgi:hypothetical protein